eukprot:TRINITY_DN4552_c0_g1_i1.p2 TRINITY_DN4552_c0_g1~~TRINITY_DN4552_c0_g1_i1.p2  ORF type:complete len:132 (-),score=31.90 TRINITY_DN4552_c0_g1_i1:445-840(-)
MSKGNERMRKRENGLGRREERRRDLTWRSLRMRRRCQQSGLGVSPPPTSLTCSCPPPPYTRSSLEEWQRKKQGQWEGPSMKKMKTPPPPKAGTHDAGNNGAPPPRACHLKKCPIGPPSKNEEEKDPRPPQQ